MLGPGAESGSMPQGGAQSLDFVQEFQGEGGARGVHPKVSGQPGGHLDAGNGGTGKAPVLRIVTDRFHDVLHDHLHHLATLQVTDPAEPFQVVLDPFIEKLTGQDVLVAFHGHTPKCFLGFIGIWSRMRS